MIAASDAGPSTVQSQANHQGSEGHIPARLRRLEALARLLDAAFEIPFTRFRVGLDAVVGLVPGWGDVLSGLASGYIVIEAWRLGVSASTLLRMLGNIALDVLLGSVPALGDLFDVGWRANIRNVALLEQHLAHPSETRRASRRALLGVLGLLGLVLVAGVTLPLLAIVLLVR